MRDKAWFFGSYRYTNREDDVVDARHQPVHAHGRQHPAPGLRQGQLGGDRRPTWSASRYLSDPTDITRPPPARHHQRPRPRPRAGRPPLRRQLHPRVGRHAARGRRQQAQRRGHRPVGDPRVAQRRAVPDRRRAHADRRAARRLRPRPDRPARQQADPRLAAAASGATTRSRAAPSGTAPTTSATRSTSTARASRRWPTSTAAPASPRRRSPPAAGRACSSTSRRPATSTA